MQTAPGKRRDVGWDSFLQLTQLSKRADSWRPSSSSIPSSWRRSLSFLKCIWAAQHTIHHRLPLHHTTSLLLVGIIFCFKWHILAPVPVDLHCGFPQQGVTIHFTWCDFPPPTSLTQQGPPGHAAHVAGRWHCSLDLLQCSFLPKAYLKGGSLFCHPIYRQERYSPGRNMLHEKLKKSY